MPLPSAIKLFIDPKQGLAFGNFAGSSQISNPTFTLGDTAGIEIYLVENTQVATYPRQEIGFPTSPGIKVAIGSIDESPTAGTWTIAYGGNTSSALPYNATAAQLQAALNALASITAAGGVTVSKVGDNYNIAFNTAGVRTELTTDGSSLIPISTATVATLQAGTVSKPQISLVHLQRTVAGLATTFTQTTASQITVDTLAAWDGSKASFRVSISPDPKGGTFTLAFDAQTGDDVSTASINVGASALDVQNALNIKALVDKVAVSQVGAYAYDISVSTQPGTNGLTANAAGLLSFSGYKGDLSLNTAEAISLLDGAESVETTLEVEITSDSKTLTLLQIPCTLKNAVIDEGAVEPLVLDTYLSQTTADGRYLRQSNNLSDLGSASTARTNLGVYSTSQVDTALALKADVSHTQAISSITGLQTALDAKANTSHTQAISTITGLQTALDAKASLAGAAFTGSVTTTERMAIGGGLANNAAHKLAIYDGNIVFSAGFGVAFGDGTMQTTAFQDGGNVSFQNINLEPNSQSAWVGSELDKTNLRLVYDTTSTNATNVFSQEALVQTDVFRLRRVSLTENPNDPGSYIETENIGLNIDPYEGLTFRNSSNGYIAGTLRYSPTGIRWPDGVTQTTRGLAISGGTLTGKLTCAVVGGQSGMNIGIGGNEISSTTPGDMWIATGGVSLNFRDAQGAWRQCLTTSSAGVINVNSNLTALRVTQSGSGAALIVEDSTTPDTSAFIVDNAGNVGIGVAAGYTPTSKVEVVGNVKASSFSNGSVTFTIDSTTSHTGGSATLDALVTINGIGYRIALRPI